MWLLINPVTTVEPFANVVDADLVAVALLNLAEQRQRIVIVAKTHRLAGRERVKGAEYRGMTEAFGDATRV